MCVTPSLFRAMAHEKVYQSLVIEYGCGEIQEPI